MRSITCRNPCGPLRRQRRLTGRYPAAIVQVTSLSHPCIRGAAAPRRVADFVRICGRCRLAAGCGSAELFMPSSGCARPLDGSVPAGRRARPWTPVRARREPHLSRPASGLRRGWPSVEVEIELSDIAIRLSIFAHATAIHDPRSISIVSTRKQNHRMPWARLTW